MELCPCIKILIGVFAALDAASNGPPAILLKQVKNRSHYAVLGIFVSVF